jgi:hypothetical protein
VSQNRAANKELRALLRAIERAGATVVFSRRHWKVYNSDGALVAVIAGTCSSRQAHHNVRAGLRRAGLDVKVPR